MEIILKMKLLTVVIGQVMMAIKFFHKIQAEIHWQLFQMFVFSLDAVCIRLQFLDRCNLSLVSLALMLPQKVRNKMGMAMVGRRWKLNQTTTIGIIIDTENNQTSQTAALIILNIEWILIYNCMFWANSGPKLALSIPVSNVCTKCRNKFGCYKLNRIFFCLVPNTIKNMAQLDQLILTRTQTHTGTHIEMYFYLLQNYWEIFGSFFIFIEWQLMNWARDKARTAWFKSELRNWKKIETFLIIFLFGRGEGRQQQASNRQQ